jgi:hypothetical protein
MTAFLPIGGHNSFTVVIGVTRPFLQAGTRPAHCIVTKAGIAANPHS